MRTGKTNNMKKQQEIFSWDNYSCIIVGGTWPIEAFRGKRDRSDYERGYYQRRKAKKAYEQSRGNNGGNGTSSRQQ